MNDSSRELVEVVDEAGNVVEVTTRGRMRAQTLRHRCVYVAVVVGQADLFHGVDADSFEERSSLAGSPQVSASGLLSAETELVVHKRADWKDTCPSYWDVAFGGVCDVGEDWRSAAARELSEEAGIGGSSLLDLGPCAYEEPTNRIVGRAFIAAWPDHPVSVDGEVVAFDRVPLGEINRWVSGRPVCPDSAELVLPRVLALVEGRS